MNERIRELVLQANPASKEIYESDNWEYNCAAWCAKDLAKFAELIVADCVNELEAHKKCDPYTGELIDSDWNDITQFQIINIKEHFGVEE